MYKTGKLFGLLTYHSDVLAFSLHQVAIPFYYSSKLNADHTLAFWSFYHVSVIVPSLMPIILAFRSFYCFYHSTFNVDHTWFVILSCVYSNGSSRCGRSAGAGSTAPGIYQEKFRSRMGSSSYWLTVSKPPPVGNGVIISRQFPKINHYISSSWWRQMVIWRKISYNWRLVNNFVMQKFHLIIALYLHHHRHIWANFLL